MALLEATVVVLVLDSVLDIVIFVFDNVVVVVNVVVVALFLLTINIVFSRGQ